LENPATCELRSVIRFRYVRDTKPADIRRRICGVYGENEVNVSMVRRWVRLFNEGRVQIFMTKNELGDRLWRNAGGLQGPLLWTLYSKPKTLAGLSFSALCWDCSILLCTFSVCPGRRSVKQQGMYCICQKPVARPQSRPPPSWVFLKLKIV